MTSEPTHSDPPAARKPRRLGLYLPWGFAVLLVIGWSVAWFWMAIETGRRLDAAAAALRASGWRVAWASRTVEGYPFRLDVNLTDLNLTDPTGWGLSTAQLDSEAPVFAPTHWLFALPHGLTFTRPGAGVVVVTARVLRASVNSWDQHPPRLSLEGDDLTFTPAPGAKPFWLTRAHVLLFDTRAGPDDQGASYLSIDGAEADPAAGWLGQVAQGQPLTLIAETTFNHASALRGRDGREAVIAWAHGGGVLSIDQLTLSAGGAGLASKRGAVSVSNDGWVVGGMDATLTAPSRMFRNVPRNGAPALHLDFHDRATWLGPLKLGPAPRAF